MKIYSYDSKQAESATPACKNALLSSEIILIDMSEIKYKDRKSRYVYICNKYIPAFQLISEYLNHENLYLNVCIYNGKQYLEILHKDYEKEACLMPGDSLPVKYVCDIQKITDDLLNSHANVYLYISPEVK